MRMAKKRWLPGKLRIQLSLGLDGRILVDLEANREVLDLGLGLFGQGVSTEWK